MCLLNSICCKAFSYFLVKVDGRIKKYYRTKYLGLFHSDEKYEFFDRQLILINI